VDQRVQLAVEPPLDLGDRRVGVVGVGEVDLDVILRAGLPRTVFRERMPRRREDAPPGSREALDGRMSDAAARAGQKQCPPRLVAGWHLLVFRFFSVPSLPAKQSGQLSGANCGSVRRVALLLAPVSRCLRIEARLAPRRGRARTGEGDAVMQPERPLLPELDLL